MSHSTATSAPPARRASAPQRAMKKLGLVRDIDLALHLPIRYDDETRLSRIADLQGGEIAQIEGEVRASRVEFRPRRQLVVRIDDGSGELVLRFLHFYPSHQKTLREGARIRVRGEVRGGFFGREMVRWRGHRSTSCCRRHCCRRCVARRCRRCVKRCSCCTTRHREARWPRWRIAAIQPGCV
jgi:RecG-like helicase